jgi:RNA polymerase sigma-70 factor (ECF subfamily)
MTMKEAFKYFSKVRDLDKPEYWLFKVARQRRARIAEDQGKHGKPIPPEDLPHLAFHEGRYTAVEEHDRPVFVALAQLPEEQREAVVLHAFDVPHKDIAELQNIEVNSARSRVSRAHARMRKLLGEEN